MAAVPVAPPPSSPEAAPLSQGARIINTFIAPSKTFTDIRRSASWWAPYLLMILVTWVFVFIAGQKVGFVKMAENQMRAQPKQQARIESMPAADREKAMAMAGKFTAVIGYASPALQLIILLIISTLLFATFKVAAGADVSFKASFAVVMFASLPGVVRALLSIVTLLAGASPDSFTLQNPLGSNIGYYLNPADSPFLYSLGSQIDLFMIWTLVLTAIGFTCVSKIKSATAYGVVFGWWLFFTLALSSLALLA